MKPILERIDTRSFIAISLTISMIALTFVLALRGPETDAFKVLLGAMLTVGFASAIGWYFNSNAGSDKKDDNQAIVAQELAKKVPVATVAVGPASTAQVPPWWARLTDDEKNLIAAAMAADPRIETIKSAMTAGAANADDIAYLVKQNLLTQARADEIQKA